MKFDSSTNRKQRIDWFYEQYANVNISVEQFIQGVNDVYYSVSASYYSSRYVDDIVVEYTKLIDVLNQHVELSDFQFVSIGGGQGFEYETISNLVKPLKSFTIIEPDKAMYAELLATSAAGDVRVHLYNCFFQEIKHKLSISNPKMIIINSVLHHIINLNSFIDDLKDIIHDDDILILSHEPNNSCNLFYYKIGWLLKKFKVLLNRGISQQRPIAADIDRWNSINKILTEKGISRNTIPAIVIRRIIDYGVGYKRDLEKLSIPKLYNEGFWSFEDIKELLGPKYTNLYHNTYRHFGDPNNDKIVVSLNNFIQTLDKKNGTNFISAWSKMR